MESSLDSEGPCWILLDSLLVQDLSAGTIGSYSISLLVLLFISALISGSEVAFFSLSTEDIDQCSTSDSPSEKRIFSLLQRPKRLLATILICNNLVNVAIVTLVTFFSWELFGMSDEGWIIFVITGVTTVLIVFFGEVVPKVYANHQNLGFARFTSGMLSFSSIIFYPVAYLLMRVSRIVENRIDKKGYVLSKDALHEAVKLTTEEQASREEKDILKGIVNFSSISVKQIMKSRIDITAIDKEMDFHQLMDKINKSGLSRLPVYEDTLDTILGILYVKDLLPFIDQEETFSWQKLMRDSFYVPESKKIDDLLKDFQDKRVHMAIVVDEYGGTSGLVTLEDVIEEIVGEINDEFDIEHKQYTKIDENQFVFQGKTSLNDFSKVMDVDPDIFDEVKGENESIGGLLLELHSGLPPVGETISFGPFEFHIESVTSKKIKSVRIKRVEKEEGTEHED